MCTGVHREEVKLKKRFDLGAYMPFNKEQGVWVLRDDQLWGNVFEIY